MLVILTAAQALAEVTRIEITERSKYAAGRSFAGVGPYERLVGRVFFAVDPNNRANGQIVDLPLAPRNDAGLVEFSADVEILAPVDRSKTNGALFYDVNNRGRRMCLRMFNEHADDFLMRMGYVVVWSGWIAEVLPEDDMLRLDAPIATRAGQPITGLHRAEIMLNEAATRYSISNRPWVGSYEPTQRGRKQATLTRRLRERDPRVSIPRDRWQLKVTPVSAPGHEHILPRVELILPAGIQPGWIYELIYEAQNPVVQGLGLAGIRDLVSFLKYDHSRKNPLYDDGKSAVERAIGFGISQSGRCLRMMLYQGFNADERHRQVFDGMIPHVAGGGLGFFNHRFAAPTRYATQHVNHLFPCDLFPFAYEIQKDPLSGREDGILQRAREDGVVPKIMHIQNSAEYWNRAGSLVHTDPAGRRDAEIPEEVRIYAVGGAQHGWGDDETPASERVGTLPNNPTDYRPHLRAMLAALDDWIQDGTAPPASVYPKIADGTLVDWRARHSGWKQLPGVRYPEVIQTPALLDYGPNFLTRGFIERHPPAEGSSYTVLVPACGEDNNERGMLKLPTIAVPLATFTGWNLRGSAIGAEHEMTRLRGARIPLRGTRTARLAAGDPRPALLERYRDFGDYLAKFDAAAARLVEQRMLLQADAQLLHTRAERQRRHFEP